MSEVIKTRIFNHGDEKESEWPSMFGTGESGHFYWDEEENKLKEGFPPRKTNFYGYAPNIIVDSISPYYHPAAEAYVDSRSKLQKIDKTFGTITTDKKLAPDPREQIERNRRRREDGTRALHRAVAQIDAGTAALTEEQKAKCSLQNEIVSNALNFDAFNAAGRKDDPRGKKYRRK